MGKEMFDMAQKMRGMAIDELVVEDPGEGLWHCKVCGFVGPDMTAIRNHMVLHHKHRINKKARELAEAALERRIGDMMVKVAYLGEKGSVEAEVVRIESMLYVAFETTNGRKFTVQFVDGGEGIRIRDSGVGDPITITPEAANAFSVR